MKHQFSSVQSFSHVLLFETLWTAARQAILSITNSWSSLRLTSIEPLVPSNHLTVCCPLLLCLQSFPTSESFQMSQLFALDGQRIGVSVSTLVLPMNIKEGPIKILGGNSLAVPQVKSLCFHCQGHRFNPWSRT